MSHRALPDAWVNRIFDQMTGYYGARFLDLWRGTDLAIVKATWAEKLGGFIDRPEAIKQALSALDSQPHPPTLPQFLAICRECALRIGDSVPKLNHVPTPEEKARADEAAKAVSQAISNKPGRNHRHWARVLLERHDNGDATVNGYALQCAREVLRDDQHA